MGFALYQAQIGKMHGSAKPIKGFGGASVIEIIDDNDGDTFRSIYTVKFDSAVYVLHAFQKKSKKGIETSQKDIELVKRRLKIAEADHKTKAVKTDD